MTARFEVINPENIAIYTSSHQQANNIKQLLLDNEIAGFALVVDNYVAVNLEGKDLDLAITFLHNDLNMNGEFKYSTEDVMQEMRDMFKKENDETVYAIKLRINNKVWLITQSEFWYGLLMIIVFVVLVIRSISF